MEEGRAQSTNGQKKEGTVQAIQARWWGKEGGSRGAGQWIPSWKNKNHIEIPVEGQK